MARRPRVGRFLKRTLVVVLVVLAAATVLVLWSRPGQRAALDVALGRLRGVFAGELTVGDIRSSGLLGGFTLVDVRLDTGDGRPFLSLDSLEARYTPQGMLLGEPSFSSVTVWGLQVEISRYTEDEELNVTRLLESGPPRADSTAGAPTEIDLGRVRIVDGLLEVLSPADDARQARRAAPGLAVPSPVGDGWLNRLALESLDMELDRTHLRLGGTEPVSAFLSRLETEVHLFERPIDIRGAQGRLAYGPGGITLDEAFLRLPGSVLSGSLTLGPRITEGSGWALGTELATEEPGELEDLRWLDPQIPDGTFRGAASITAGDVVDVELSDAHISLEASDLRLDGGFRMDGGPNFRDLRVEASPLVLERLEPWLQEGLPLRGFLTGGVTLTGRPTALETSGRVTLVPEGLGGTPTTADLQGTVHLGDDIGFTNAHVRLDPLNFGLLDMMEPGIGPGGSGRAEVDASGRLSSGIRVVADVSHGSDTLTSRLVARGTVGRRGSGPFQLDLLTDLDSVSLNLLDQLVPRYELTGAVGGTLRTVGPTDRLRVLGDLRVAEGDLSLDGTVDLSAPDSLYRLDAELDGVSLSRISRRLPEPSLWSGTVSLEGSGFTADSASTRVEIRAWSSRVGGLHVDSLDATVRTEAGLLTVDTAVATLGGVSLGGGGRLGLVEGRTGEAHVSIHAASLAGLRPLLLGDTVIAGDTLTVLEAELLRHQGIDAATLPDSADVAMRGELDGSVELRGSLRSLTAEGRATVRDAVYGENHLDSLALQFRAEELPSWDGSITAEVVARGLRTGERSFQELDASVSMVQREGEASVRVLREPGEQLDLAGDFALDSVGDGMVDLSRGRLRLDSLEWEVEGESRVRWAGSTVHVEDLVVTRNVGEPMRLQAAGDLSWGGASDFHLEVDGAETGALARLLEVGDLGLEGTVDTDIAVRGPARLPQIDLGLRWTGARYREVALDSVTGSLRYRSRTATLDLEAWDGGRRTFRAQGDVPVDLALDSVGDRVLSRRMDVQVRADSLPAANVLSFLGFLEDIEGTVSGDFTVGGTLDAVEPSGVFRLDRGAWTLSALGVRHSGVGGSLTLHPDRTVDVALFADSPGSVEVEGTVDARTLTNPELFLDIGFDNFQAVSRADIEGRISGDLRLTGSYQRPVAEGGLRVDQGTLFLEEFARSSEVVDLSDPRIFQAVDTTALSTRPILAGVRNPFLDNLRVDVDLSVPRAVWLRSEDMNVEMGGELLVTYDRTDRDLVMVGQLEALRGSYVVLGRTFTVEGGTVGFIGTPGINPTLDIQTVARIRRVQGEPIDVTASVDGTLTQPRVALSSDDAGLAESDLVSYLIFGRPSFQLASRQAGLAAAAGTVSYFSGTLANRLGSALAREVGVDYVNITQAAELGTGVGLLSGTRIEVGRYVSDDVFIVLVFRPPTEQGSQNVFGGARVEWSLNDPYTVQAFVEDRFLRSGVGGFRDFAIEPERVIGVFVFREWGY